MTAHRICVTFSAIATLAIALPAIAVPSITPPTKTPSATSKPTAVKPISITDIVGVYQLLFQSDLIKIKSDGSYEMVRRKNFRDPKTEYMITGRVRIENNVVLLEPEITEGPENIEPKGNRVNLRSVRFNTPPGYSLRQYALEQGGGKALILRADPIVKFIKIE